MGAVGQREETGWNARIFHLPNDAREDFGADALTDMFGNNRE